MTTNPTTDISLDSVTVNGDVRLTSVRFSTVRDSTATPITTIRSRGAAGGARRDANGSGRAPIRRATRPRQ